MKRKTIIKNSKPNEKQSELRSENETSENNEKETVNNMENNTPKDNLENETNEMEQESVHSLQGDSGIDVDMEKELPEVQISPEDETSIPGTVTCATQTYSNKGRKRKSEMAITEDTTFKDKKYQFVSRNISQSASRKYNLRRTRKALVLSDDETGDKDLSEYDDDDDDDDDDDEYDDDDDDDDYKYSESEYVQEADSQISSAVYNKDTSQTMDSVDKDVSDVQENDQSLQLNSNEMNNLTENSQIQSDEESENVLGECKTSKENEDKLRQISLLQNKFSSKRTGLYNCDLCGKGFNKTLYLFRHIRKHTGEFTCQRCHKVFARKENMIKHNCPAMINSQGDGNFEFSCNYCKKSFYTEKLLAKHKIKHTGEFTCSDCKKSYSTKVIFLVRHVINAMKPSTEQFNCSICNKSFTKETYLLKHLPVHTGQHSCPICGKWLRSVESLTNHMRMCGQVKEIEVNGQAKCPNCQEVFTDIIEFRRHQYEHTHIHACETCGARFRNRVSLGLHVCQGKDLNCDMCNKVFTNHANLQRHKFIHGEPIYKCSKCGKGFHRKDSLLKHPCERAKNNNSVLEKKKKSGNLMPLICEICGSMFSCTSSLNVHKNLHGEKKFSCDYCGKKFHRKDILLEHHAVHGAPSFPCPTCHKLFKTRKSLDTHVMIHDGVKRYKCAKCGKEFFQKGNLQKHEETHNKERKHICTVCQKSFSTREYLYIHMLEHTRGRIYGCGVCGRSFVKEHQLRSHHRMFHSNQSYSCKYCGLSLKLRHSLKRHLRKKHSEFENEWKKADFVNAMLITKNTAKQTDPSSESYIIPDITSTQGAEVLLAVAGLGNQELQDALVSGQAQIKQGTSPDTFEISVPFNNEQDDNITNDGQIILTTESGTDITLPNNFIQKQLQCPVEVMCSDDGKQYITLPVESNGAVRSEGEPYQITLPLQSEVDGAEKLHGITIPLDQFANMGEEYEITLQREETGDKTHGSNNGEKENYQILSDVAGVEEHYEVMRSEEYGNIDEQYEVTTLSNQQMAGSNDNEYEVTVDNTSQELASTNQYQITLPNQEMSENEQFQITLSNEQNDTNLVAQTEDGQQIVISGKDLPVGTHHIVLNTSKLSDITDTDNLDQDTIVLEEGATILQRQEGDVLLYVLTNEQQP
ncbi:zinc finger protein 226-like [Centruroides sculpturatus]|uniref:zinc finger protein 226-like n=1 Tax=Centruroides sculpturatus TaxID=218467 RepID=UPI000C6ED8B9|nr:zinc finger protein 226-like [Centruroides sculpturatus]